MATVIPLTFRNTAAAAQTQDCLAALIEITHPEMVGGPLRLSGDPTTRVSVDPLTYGTYHLGDLYSWAVMALVLPDQEPGSVPRARIVFENVDNDMVRTIRSVLLPARLNITLVTASVPDEIIRRFTGLQVVRAPFKAGQVSLECSREPFLNMAYPFHRMSRQRLPALFDS